MTKIQSSKHGFRKLEFRISNLFRISIFEFRILTQKGVSLYLALMIMTVLLAITFGIATIFLGQTKMIRGMGYSVIAFYAADIGIEKVLVDREELDLTPDYYSGSLVNGATYQVFVTEGGTGDCLASNYCIESIGSYKETHRAIEISY